MTKLKFVIPILLLGILVLVGTGCDSREEPSVPSRGGGVTPGVPTSDASGKDISDIPRYPGSVRTYYGPVPGGLAPGMIFVVYLTSANIDTVKDFYEEQLSVHGWKSSMDEETMKEFGFAYRYVGPMVEKEGQQIIVLVQPSSDYSGYNEINISQKIKIK